MFDTPIPLKYTLDIRTRMPQTFTNCVHGYDCARNVHTDSVTRTQKFVHGINSTV